MFEVVALVMFLMVLITGRLQFISLFCLYVLCVIVCYLVGGLLVLLFI